MPTGFVASGPWAYSDKTFQTFSWADANTPATVGMPCYINFVNAAEFVSIFSTTAIAASANLAGLQQVVSGTNINAGVCIGVYQPVNLTDTALASSSIRVQTSGPGLVLATAKASGTPVTVDAVLISDTTQTGLLAGSATTNKTVGMVTANGQSYNSSGAAQNTAAINGGASVIAVPGSGNTSKVINAYIHLT